MSEEEAKVPFGVVLCCGTVWLIWTVLFNGLQIGFGVAGLDTCDAEPIDLGVWLIVSGVIGFVYSVVSCLPKIQKMCNCCFSVFFLAWFIIGAYCLFQHDNLQSCHVEAESQQLWGAALFFWIFGIAVLFLICVVVLCFGICFASILALIGIAEEDERNRLV